MSRQGFEVNTDMALVNFDWATIEVLHEQRYSLAIDYIKSIVQGDNYENSVMDLVASDDGFYVQAKRFPAAFYGDTSKAEITFVSEEKARDLVWEAIALFRAGEVRSLHCVYSENEPPDVFLAYKHEIDDQVEMYERGFLKNVHPLHLRVMVDASESCSMLQDKKGTLIYQQTSDGQHIVVKVRGEANPFPLLNGFNE